MFVYIGFATILFLIPAALVAAELGGALTKTTGGVYTWIGEALGQREPSVWWGVVALDPVAKGPRPRTPARRARATMIHNYSSTASAATTRAPSPPGRRPVRAGTPQGPASLPGRR